MQKFEDKLMLFVAIVKLPLTEFSGEKITPVVLDEQKEENLSIITDEEERASTIDLEEILGTGDLATIEQYVNNHFSNLSQEEMLMKLLSLNEHTRLKLLEIINQIKSNKTDEDVEMKDATEQDYEEEIFHDTLEGK
jgi:hypothetical protein